MVKRFHRHLKSAIIAHEDAGWTDILPIVLLGLRSAMKNDLNATSSELVYAVTIDRCKPAFEFSEDFNSQKGSSNFEPPLTKQQIEDKRTTRSSRHVHSPKRLTY
ncbi:hypothetical protein TNCV_2613191 [Trichonephila clavipes]|nr:hypothetical protein TNCV_2613191 [Trichonephila clavipes]